MTVLKVLSRISENVDQHSVMLSEISNKINLNNADKLIKPVNMPERFPFTTLEEFQEFETMLSSDDNIWQYMVISLFNFFVTC